MTSFPTTSGIYRITCIVTGKFYIGSAINLCKRKNIHLHALRRNTHENPKLQNAWNKYGEPTFTFEVLELVLPMSLTAREQYWFEKLKPFDNKGFNIAREAGSQLGLRHSPKTKGKIRQANLGKRLSEDHKRKLAEANKGKKHSSESIEKYRLARLGHPVSAETRAKISAAYTAQMKTIIVTSPDGAEYLVTGIKKFCRENHLHSFQIMQVAKGRYSQHKGWKARYPETDI